MDLLPKCEVNIYQLYIKIENINICLKNDSNTTQ